MKDYNFLPDFDDVDEKEVGKTSIEVPRDIMLNQVEIEF